MLQFILAFKQASIVGVGQYLQAQIVSVVSFSPVKRWKSTTMTIWLL